MEDRVDLDDLDRMDDDEVAAIKGLVSGLFGAFDPSVEIDGVYFGRRRYPHTVYLSETDRFLVAVCIPVHQAELPLARLAHLSHELVHCLNPNGLPPQATILEEGLAEHSKIYLSRQYFQKEYPDFDFRDMTAGKYLAAFDLVEELVAHEQLDGMRTGIQKLRAITGRPFGRINEHDLAEQFTRTPRSLLEQLSRPFRD